jgi:hypothetical protein
MTEAELNNKIGQIIERYYDWLKREIKQNIAKDGMSGYAEELLHFIIMELYNKSPEKKQKLLDDNKIPFWILTSSGLQLRSSSSPFYNLIRRNKLQARSGDLDFEEHIDIQDIPYDSEMYDCFKKGMEQLNWYNRKLLEEKFLNQLSFKAISEKYNISTKHLRKDVYIALLEIRKFCKYITL